MEQPTKQERNYNLLPIEEKESYKWIASSQKSKEVLHQAKKVIIIQDREGDIYEQFAVVPDQKTQVISTGKSQQNVVK